MNYSNCKYEKIFIFGIVLSLFGYFIPFLRVGSFISQSEDVDSLLAVNLLLLFFSSTLTVLFGIKKNVPVQLKLSLYLIIFSIATSSLFAININYTACCKFTVFILLPYFFIQALDSISLKKVVVLLISVCFALTVYGFYGYLTGNVGVQSQEFWWDYAKYWGIHYLPSTRNTDVYIPAVAFFFVLPSIFRKVYVYGKLYLILAVTFLSAIILSLSRGSWISTILVIMCYFLINNRFNNFNSRKILKFVVSFIFIVVIAFFVAIKYGESDYMIKKMASIYKINEMDNSVSSNKQRIYILRATLDIISNNPLGVGLENLRYHYPQYGLNVNHSENNYLNIIAELGIVGFIGFLILIFYPLKIIYKKLYSNPDGLQISFFLVLIYMTIAYFFNVVTFGVFVWIIHALSWSFISNESID